MGLDSCEFDHSDQIGFRMVMVHLYIYYAFCIYVIAYRLRLSCLRKLTESRISPHPWNPFDGVSYIRQYHT